MNPVSKGNFRQRPNNTGGDGDSDRNDDDGDEEDDEHQSPGPTHQAVLPSARAILKETAPNARLPRPKNEAMCCILKQGQMGVQETSSEKVIVCIRGMVQCARCQRASSKDLTKPSMGEGEAADPGRATVAAAN